MAEASMLVDEDQFSCPVCLDLLKDPVTISCGHTFCQRCFNAYWILYDKRGDQSYSQCRKPLTLRPVLHSSSLKDAEEAQIKEMKWEFWQRIYNKEKKLKEVKEAVKTLQSSAQAAVEDSERIFAELIRSIEKKRCEVTELIRAQEEAELSGAEELLEQLEQEIADLKRRDAELEQLSHTEDHVHFLQSFQSLSVSSGSEDSASITVHQHPSFDGVRKSLSDLKERLEEFCKQEFRKISLYSERSSADEEHEGGSLPAPSVYRCRKRIELPAEMGLYSELKSREDFLQYFCRLTLDPNTVNQYLSLSEENRVVMHNGRFQRYSDHPERFDYWYQVLSKESVSGRCYWEVEWSSEGWLYISVSYKGISRKGQSNESWFGHNSQSWSLQCSPSSLSFYHNNIQTELSASSSSRIGVYVDHSAGTLSFYSVSDTLTLLHTVHTTFTQPLHAGFWVNSSGSTVKLCDPK